MRFVDVKNDVAFRKVFGNENRKESLISFLNAILDFHGDHRIATVTILNPYQLPSLRGGKVSIIDVKATDQAGRTYVVEMQLADVDGFDKRVLYYTAKSYADQINRADFYRNLRPVIFVGILNFEQTQNKSYISRSQVRDVETGERTIQDIEFTFIELPKFRKQLSELSTLTEKWVYFIKESENLEVLPEGIRDEGLMSAYEEANIQTWTKAELDAYEYAFMREEDYRAVKDKAIKNAVAKAVEQAKHEERELAAQNAEAKEKEMILAMYKTGIAIAQIAAVAQKTEDEVRAIIAAQA